MFSKADLEYLKQYDDYTIIQANHHDMTIHSQTTGHDWVFMSNYETADCYILHRHSRRDPYHRQKGNYCSLTEALKYINNHEKWFATHKMKHCAHKE